MKTTLDLQEIPRFLACPGSFLWSQKAELFFGPVEVQRSYGEDAREISLQPALPITGMVDDLSVSHGICDISMPGDKDVLTAAMVAVTAEYDFAYEFNMYNVTYLTHDGKGETETLTKNDLFVRATEMQERFKKALESTERIPNTYCDECPARSICPEYKGEILDTLMVKDEVATAEELGAVLPKLKALTEKAEESVRKMLVKGTKVPGYKLGEANEPGRTKKKPSSD